MPSLSQLLTDHRRLLVLDAASTHVQVGLLQSGEPALWQGSTGEAGVEAFRLTEEILGRARISLAEVGALVYCEGPGSILGIRSVAMAVRTWQVLQPRPAYTYQSLAVASAWEWRRTAPRSFSLVADARRETWHCMEVGADGRSQPLRRVPAAALPAGELVTPESFRSWSVLPRPVSVCSYDLAKIFAALTDGDFFRASDSPDAFQHDAPDYKKWSAQIHQAPVASRP